MNQLEKYRFYWNKLKKLDERKIDRLANIMLVGFLHDDIDKEDKIMVLLSESIPKVEKALKKLKVD